MKTHTAYVQVPCSELPTKDGQYLTNIGWQSFRDGMFFHQPSWSQRIDWWLEKREDVIVMTKEELANSTIDLINDCEIPIPIEELMNVDKTHLTKNQYGLVLLKNLCIEIKEKLCKS